jgi:hypothetical protein
LPHEECYPEELREKIDNDDPVASLKNVTEGGEISGNVAS